MLGSAGQRIAAIGLGIRIRVVGLEAEAVVKGPHPGHLGAHDPAAAAVGALVNRKRAVEQVRYRAGGGAARVGWRVGRDLQDAVHGPVGDKGLDVLVEEREGQRVLAVRVPLDGRLGLVGAIRVEVRIAAGAGEGARIQAGPRRDVGEVGPGHHPRRGKTVQDVVVVLVGEIDARHNVRVTAISPDRIVITVGVLDLPLRTAEVAGRALLGVDDAQAEVAAPASGVDIGHGVPTQRVLVHRKTLLRIQDAAGVPEIVEQQVARRAAVDLPIGAQRARRRDPVQEIRRCHGAGKGARRRRVDRHMEPAVGGGVEHQFALVRRGFDAEID